MKKREEIIEVLNKFYNEKGITPDDNFNCPNKDNCNRRDIPLAQGMQCHVGTEYGEAGKIKALVVSLDCGGGGKETIEDRTKDVQEGHNNPQMKGTTLCISDLLQMKENPKESLSYYAMTNSCKCSRKDSSNQLPDFFYEQCAEFKIKEIELIDPDVAYFQGKNALIGVNFENIDNRTDGIFEHLKHLRIGNKKIYAVQCIHPSARGSNYKRRVSFYDEKLPKINDYIRKIIK